MKCEICNKEVGEEGVEIKTKGIKGHREYHLECFDEMWNAFDEMRTREYCNCCGEELNEYAEMGKCVHCIKGNCELCGEDK